MTYMKYKRFQGFIKDLLPKKVPSETTAAFLLRTIAEHRIKDAYPNVHTALQIYLTLMVTNCTGERSFSKLKLVENYLRST